MQKLDEIPDDVDVVWFGRSWDPKGCTEETRIYPPEGEFCHGCIGPLGVRSSGVATRDAEGRWIYFDPGCWGDYLAEKYAAETLEADADYERRPGPEDW